MTAYRFDHFEIRPTERRLLVDGHPASLGARAFDLLLALVERRDRTVTKNELLARIWPESFVEEGILTVHMSALRKALGDDTRPASYIETVARSGYRFIASVIRDPADDERSTLTAHSSQTRVSRPVRIFPAGTP